jgi:hypothetical protein
MRLETRLAAKTRDSSFARTVPRRHETEELPYNRLFKNISSPVQLLRKEKGRGL